ncbi:unnamed protein product [Closterium sp. Yama58-4]|nr:unnamed protein product [Closterium sp. Yama58-4]
MVTTTTCHSHLTHATPSTPPLFSQPHSYHLPRPFLLLKTHDPFPFVPSPIAHTPYPSTSPTPSSSRLPCSYYQVAHSAWEVVTDSHLDPSAPLFNLFHSLLCIPPPPATHASPHHGPASHAKPNTPASTNATTTPSADASRPSPNNPQASSRGEQGAVRRTKSKKT